MKKALLILLIPITLLSMAFSCENEKMCCLPPDHDGQGISGTWLLYETGYSPGAGYVVNDVPANPEQVLTLHQDSTLSTTIDGLEDYKFYQILQDQRSNAMILSLYRTNPKGEPQDRDSLSHSYIVELKDGVLKLYYRFCIEGCHLAFKRK